MNEKSFEWKKLLVNLDQYTGAVVFILVMILLATQVISRYVFNHSITWTEELSIIMFVWMTFLGISSAVTHRKHLKIDALLNAVPFNVKRILLIISDIIFVGFNTYIIFPFSNIINGFGNAKTPIIGVPKALCYIVVPLMLTISSIKLIYDIMKLFKEKEKAIGASIPAIDFEMIEREREGAL